MNSVPSAKLLLCALLSLCGFGGLSRADIIYRKINGGQGAVIRPGQKPVNVNMQTGEVSLSAAVPQLSLALDGGLASHASVYTGTGLSCSALQKGTPVNAQNTAHTGFLLWFSTGGYLGVSFMNGDRVNYGWISLNLELTATDNGVFGTLLTAESLTVNDMAYEDSGGPIAAGAVQPVSAPELSISSSRELSWQSLPGLDYQLQLSGDALIWADSGEPVSGTGGVLRVMPPAVPAPGGRGFYRLRVKERAIAGADAGLTQAWAAHDPAAAAAWLNSLSATPAEGSQREGPHRSEDPSDEAAGGDNDSRRGLQRP